MASLKADENIRVLIADDHILVRQAFRLILERAGMEVVGAVSTGRQAVESVVSLDPEVVLLDIAMPDMDGLAALTVIKYLRPHIRAFILTSHVDQSYSARALQLGASGFISKGIDPESLVEALRAGTPERPAHFKRLSLSEPQPPSLLAVSEPDQKALEVEDLTDQEALILTLLSIGYSNEAIMEYLCVSRNTLKTHLRNIYTKLGVSDRTQAAIWAVRNGLNA